MSRRRVEPRLYPVTRVVPEPTVLSDRSTTLGPTGSGMFNINTGTPTVINVTQVVQQVSPRETIHQGPSSGVAYLLWFFLGGLAAHRIYLGRPFSAIVIIIMNVIGIVFLPVLLISGSVLLLDLFHIPGWVRERGGR